MVRQRAHCSERIRLEVADFVVREKARRRLKTRQLAEALNVTSTTSLSTQLSRLQSGDIDRFGFEGLFRMVEALGFEVHLDIRPREQARAA